jgi:hypothetical protein
MHLCVGGSQGLVERPGTIEQLDADTHLHLKSFQGRALVPSIRSLVYTPFHNFPAGEIGTVYEMEEQEAQRWNFL